LRLIRSLYAQVLVGIAFGILVGVLWPGFGVALKPLGDVFIKLIKMLIAPIIFCTVAGGVAKMSDVRSVGRIGGRALIYFEVVSTFALIIGLAVALVFRPGAGFNVNPGALDAGAVSQYVVQARIMNSAADWLLHLVPDTFVSAFSTGDPLQVLLLALLTGFAIAAVERGGIPIAGAIDRVGQVFFAIVRIVVRAAPIGAFGAMAFTIGHYGLAALLKLGALVACVYGASVAFVAVVLGFIAWAAGFSLWRFLIYIREELLIVLGASSSEAVLPQLMVKLERLGAPRQVVGLVVPAGYSFNLDGTNIYMTLATLFLAQATNTPLSAGQIAVLFVTAMLTSKGAAGVTGGGFIVLAITLGAVGTIPVAAIALILGVDRFMSECRALTNVIGNGVASLVVARWEGTLDRATLAAELGSARRGLAETGPNREHDVGQGHNRA
jgi:aerobic C4-dicarboxylate transport protein